MIYKNLHIENNSNLMDIRVEKGLITEIKPSIVPLENEKTIDCAYGVAFPPLVESHIHLDTSMTFGEPEYNKSGTLFEGISLWAERKKLLTYEDVQTRALKAINLEASHGVQAIRTHVDICDPSLTALSALTDLKKKVAHYMDLQIIAFPQEGIISFKGGKELINKAIEMGADGVGAIPHYEYTREQAVESLNYIMDLAYKKSLFVDVHCDETDDESSRGLETLVARALEMGYGEKVTASHTTAMHSYTDAYVGRLMRVIINSRINFVSNPLVNINLQGRYDTYPKRRGLTRIPELIDAGINVSFGQDDIKDPWYPMGSGNLVDAVFMGIHCTQMMGYDNILDSYKFITYNGAKTLGLKNYGLMVGNPANFVVYECSNFYDVLANRMTIKYSIKNGDIIFERTSSSVKSKI